MTTTASGTAFADLPVVAGVIALLALVTALRPADLSTQHLQAASAFNSLQIAARDLWEFDLSRIQRTAGIRSAHWGTVGPKR